MGKLQRLYLLHLFTFFLVLISQFVFAQRNVVKIKHEEDRMIGINEEGRSYNILIGHVKLIQDSTTVYCDSAIFDREKNIFDAYGHTRMLMGDSVELFGDRMFYDGNTKIGEVYDNVILIDNRATLYTNYLKYNRNTKTAFYNQNGKIIDNDNELVSKIGYYYTDIDEFLFRGNVVVTNPDYVIKSDTMKYNSATEFVYFLGPTTMTGEEDYMFARKGWSDTRNSITSLKKDALVKHKQHELRGDSIYYEKETGFGQIFKNAVLKDNEKEVVIYGQFVEYFKEPSFAYATDSALAIIIDGSDSLFLHADTLRLKFDSLNEAEKLFAYKKTKFFRKSLQGACDSLVYAVNDSVINMFQKPVLWSENNQLTSDSIKIFITNQALDSMILFNNAFIVSQEQLATQFNQIKGRHVVGYFFNNELEKIKVDGNSETLYYVRDEESGGLIGINKGIANNMIIFIKDRKMQSITYFKEPKMTLFTETGLSGDARKLDGFQWLISRRPLTKHDIFKRD